MGAVTYPQILARAAVRAGLTGAWVAAGELAPARRRAVRAGMIAARAVASFERGAFERGAFERDASERGTSEHGAFERGASEHGAFDRGTSEHGAFDGARRPTGEPPSLAFGAAAATLVVTSIVIQRRLEKRWLARLAAQGHPHPVRGLAWRVTMIDFAGSVAAQLLARSRAR
ncbi:hypothetical protein KOI35_44410 [Actinoplanes bogorensis]|uniref:Uncharacterized protein n=1 Tax=Paractinoplanes bogorensis TaxID=1610840 RepID=A0ABS5Z5C9_9ACTN|nr:hypothetical protein [Actinoplanes bogorensis]MBU2670566.1 hypothetical protein [Actinoplanes bogorensis]